MHSLMALLTGRHDSTAPLSKRLNTNEQSNILLFISGHGGDEFMKFQDYEEISAFDIAHGIHEMHLKKRFKNMLFVVDTCQASTLGSLISTPNVISLSSSKKDENSYAFHSNKHLGLSVIDRFSYKMVEYFQRNGQTLGSRGKNKNKNPVFKSVGDLYRSLQPRFLQSTPVVEVSAGTLSHIDQIPLKRFFDEKLQIRSFLNDANVSCDGCVESTNEQESPTASMQSYDGEGAHNDSAPGDVGESQGVRDHISAASSLQSHLSSVEPELELARKFSARVTWLNRSPRNTDTDTVPVKKEEEEEEEEKEMIESGHSDNNADDALMGSHDRRGHGYLDFVQCLHSFFCFLVPYWMFCCCLYSIVYLCM